MQSNFEPRCLVPQSLSDESCGGTVGTLLDRMSRDLKCELGFLDDGFRCALPAVAYVEFHMVGHCRRFDCDPYGNACGVVCVDHLDALHYTAQCTASEMQPSALRRLFTRVARCPSCGRTLLGASDILQVVVGLS